MGSARASERRARLERSGSDCFGLCFGLHSRLLGFSLGFRVQGLGVYGFRVWVNLEGFTRSIAA